MPLCLGDDHQLTKRGGVTSGACSGLSPQCCWFFWRPRCSSGFARCGVRNGSPTRRVRFRRVPEVVALRPPRPRREKRERRREKRFPTAERACPRSGYFLRHDKLAAARGVGRRLETAVPWSVLWRRGAYFGSFFVGSGGRASSFLLSASSPRARIFSTTAGESVERGSFFAATASSSAAAWCLREARAE